MGQEIEIEAIEKIVSDSICFQRDLFLNNKKS